MKEHDEVHTPSHEHAIVVFTLGDHPYAIPTSRTREVVAWRMPRPLPGAESWIEGVINLRGEIIPVCDLASALGLERRLANTLDTSILIVEVDSECIGLVVDGVREVLIVAADDALDPPTVHHPALVGVLRRDQELIVMLDPDAAIQGGVARLADLIGPAMSGEHIHDAPDSQPVDENDLGADASMVEGRNAA